MNIQKRNKILTRLGGNDNVVAHVITQLTLYGKRFAVFVIVHYHKFCSVLSTTKFAVYCHKQLQATSVMHNMDE